MNLDELKSAWKCQDKKPDLGELEPDEMIDRLRTEQRMQNRAMLRANVVVAGIYVAFVVFMWVEQRDMQIAWPFYLGATLILLAAAYHPWGIHRQRQRENRLGDSLRDELMRKSEQLDYQIRFAKWGSIWGYYLPTIIALSLFAWQGYLNGEAELVRVQEAVLFFIALLGCVGYFAGELGIGRARKEKQAVDEELQALGVPVQEEKTPMRHLVARTILTVGAVAVCGYLLLQILSPNHPAGRPIEPDPEVQGASIFARVAPFTGVRWETGDDQPTVRIRGEWFHLSAVDGIPVDHLMEVAREEFGSKARKRFAEDLLEVLAAAGHDPEWTVTLMVNRGEGKDPIRLEEVMTHEKRESAKAFALESPRE